MVPYKTEKVSYYLLTSVADPVLFDPWIRTRDKFFRIPIPALGSPTYISESLVTNFKILKFSVPVKNQIISNFMFTATKKRLGRDFLLLLNQGWKKKSGSVINIPVSATLQPT
jgi:hypothetical protein